MSVDAKPFYGCAAANVRAGSLIVLARGSMQERVSVRSRFALMSAASAAVACIFSGNSKTHGQVIVPDPPPWNWLWVGAEDDTWLGGSGPFGNWIPSNNPGELRPNSFSSFAYIDPSITVDDTPGTAVAQIGTTESVTIGAIQVGAGASLSLANEAHLSVVSGAFAGSGQIINDGDISLNSTAGGSTLSFSGGLSLVGTGTLSLSDNGGNAIFANTGNAGALLSVGSSFTIRGAGVFNPGYLGSAMAAVDNNGLIEANQANNALRIQMSQNENATLTNDGTLRATNGGTLALYGWSESTFTNNGTIEALNGSIVRIETGATVSGGTITTAGTGRIRGGGGTLHNVTNTGTVALLDGDLLTLSGTFTNNGGVQVSRTGSGGGATLRMADATVLAGTGKITLGNDGQNYLYGLNNGDTVTISSGATIEGGGSINPGFVGSGSIHFVNNGLLDANNGAMSVMLYNPGGPNALDNNATIRASNGATLSFGSFEANAIFDNAGGTIEALDGSIVRLGNGMTVSGGTVTSSGSGTIRGGSAGNGGATLSNLTNTGNILIANGELLNFAGTLTNNGSVNVQSTGSGATMRLANGFVLGGNGSVTLTNDGSNYLYSINNGDTITINSGATLQGAGQVGPGFANTGIPNINNNGLINANISGGNLEIHTYGAGGANLSNGGTLRADAGTLTVSNFGGGTLSNSGTIEAINGGVFNAAAVALSNRSGSTLTGGTYRAIGTGSDLQLSVGDIDTLASGTEVVIGGAGVVRFGATPIEQTLTTNHGTLRVYDTRTLNIANSLLNTGTLHARDAGSIIAVNGTLTSTGTLGGDGSFTAALFDLGGGTLSPGNSPGSLTLDGNVVYDASTVLNFELASLLGPNDFIEINGDLTLDGTVNVTGLGGFGVGTYELMSFSGSLTDNGLDVGTLPNGYGAHVQTVPSVAGVSDGAVNLVVEFVPEPSAALASLAFTALTTAWRRRRHRIS